jgi:N-acetylmuramoyl-L-alanine amidase
MKKNFAVVSITWMVLLGVWTFSSLEYISLADLGRAMAGVFGVESVSVEDLRSAYARAQAGGEKVKVLIVPGHDQRNWGTEYAGLREEELNRMVAEALAASFAENSAFEVTLLRDKNGYLADFEQSFEEQKEQIRAEVQRKKKIMNDLLAAGAVNRADGVPHNNAALSTALRLYAANGWANAKGYEVVLHIHFNDYGGRKKGTVGKYSGFAVYIPEAQFSNARASRALGEALVASLAKKFTPSNLPKEGGGTGLVPDQELIAVGAYNTLDTAAALIEYGYIYEPGLHDPARRPALVRDYARATYEALETFFISLRI